MKQTKQMKLEDNLTKLEEVIAKLESGYSSLEDSFKVYNKGRELVKLCHAAIDKIEKEVQVIAEGGELVGFE
jgi:exodeoxyribonuclease VII small subunit